VRADEAALDLLGRAVERLHLSARAARRLLRVARTISDLADRETTQSESIAEALQMRLAW
jgi:magnesium chelatase family protein